MNLTGKEINNAYIIRSLVEENEFYERWESGAVFSPNTFFFDILRNESLSERILKKSDVISSKLMQLQSVRNPLFLRTIEYGDYKGQVFIIQQKITGITLEEVFSIRESLHPVIILKIMDSLTAGVRALERYGLSHNMLTPRSLWFPENFDALGSVFVNDILLHDLLSLSESDPLAIFPGTGSFLEEQKGIGNDLYSLGMIFRYLVTGGKSGDVEDGPVARFIDRLTGKKDPFATASQMRDAFTDQFEKKLSGRLDEVKREYLYSQETLFSATASPHYSGDTADEEDDEVEILEEIDETEDIEEFTDPERGVRNRTVLDRAKDIVKTIFGFFSRFGRGDGGSRRKKGSVREKLGSWIPGGGRSRFGSPSGDLQHKNDGYSSERLQKLFQEMASHFTGYGRDDKDRVYFSDMDFNRQNEKSENKIDSLDQADRQSGRNPLGKIPLRNDDLRNRDFEGIPEGRDGRYGFEIPEDRTVKGNYQSYIPGNNPVPGNNDSYTYSPEVPVPPSERPDIQRDENIGTAQFSGVPEILQENTEKAELPGEQSRELSEFNVEREVNREMPAVGEPVKKLSVWGRFLMFLKKIFKFIK